jgi:hypothetical protein
VEDLYSRKVEEAKTWGTADHAELVAAAGEAENALFRAELDSNSAFIRLKAIDHPAASDGAQFVRALTGTLLGRAWKQEPAGDLSAQIAVELRKLAKYSLV